METTNDLSRLDPRLRDYARLLQSRGFSVYLIAWKNVRSLSGAQHYSQFYYSREVDGVERFGSCAIVGSTFSHRMPTDRSASGQIWVEGVPEEMSVEAAELAARPVNKSKYDWDPGYFENSSPLNSMPSSEYVLFLP